MNLIRLKPELSELYTLNEFVLNKLLKENFEVSFIVEEAFINIVNYSKTDYITVKVEFDKSILTIEFIDNGIKFNPLLKEDPKLPDNIDEAQIGGLGIFLTKQLADDISYDYINGENHLKITKKVE